MKRTDAFTTIRTEGGLLPTDLLTRVAALDPTLAKLTPSEYHLAPSERVNDAISRSWNRLVGAWASFSDSLAKATPDDKTATNITRARWSLVMFQELGYGQLQAAKAAELDGKSYPISHSWGKVPVHLVGARVRIDDKTEGVVGAARMSPHGMVQEYLNRSDEHLWGFVSNGHRLRLLRDNATLTRQAYVEFDLQAMFDGQQYADFAVLWLLCHQSRLEGEQPSACVLETWSAEAAKQGTRALDQLRNGVERAIAELGTGFLQHRDNAALREALRSGALDKQDYYRQLLRLVYRLLFVFVAEGRNLLLLDDDSLAPARERYQRYYSLARIREIAQRRRGGPHGDLWAQLRVVFDALGRPEGAPALALPGLGSFLWERQSLADLVDASLPNRHLLAATRALSEVTDGKVRRNVDYRNLGSEELGSIYESLLELHPDLSVDDRTFRLTTAAGNERKTTGSYYTPTSLITELLDSALDPVLDAAASKPNAEQEILDLKVLDPACGSGHFLIAAAHRIAKRLAAVRTGDDEPSPDAIRTALRDVVGRCIHGIDINPMAVELCKVSLWMEAMEPGRPLGFLDHRIVRGNALLGATPELLDGGIPDDAFKALTGDDKSWVTSVKKRSKAAQKGAQSLFGGSTTVDTARLAKVVEEIDAVDDETFDAIQIKARRWTQLVDSDEYRNAVFAADLWCAAFVAPKTPDAPVITEEEFQVARDKPARLPADVQAAVDSLAEQYGFLHLHLAFLDAFADSGDGGFDVVLGNPPWEKVKLSEKEFFAARAPDIANLAGAKRKAAITALRNDPDGVALWNEYVAALRHAEGESHLLRSTGRFPLCGRGDVNTYAVFAEMMSNAVAPAGRLGVIVPTGIATDDTTKHFFADCVNGNRLVSLFSFENEEFVFPGVHHAFKFCLLVMTGRDGGMDIAEFSFFLRSTTGLADTNRRFSLTPDDLALINPNTKTAPIFRNRRDAEITKGIFRRVPVLIRDGHPHGNPWSIEFSTMFHMTGDSYRFRTAAELESHGASHAGNTWVRGRDKWLPLYEAKMAHQFNHRFGDYALKPADFEGSSLPDPPLECHQDPSYAVQPRYWVAEEEVLGALSDTPLAWLLGFRDITNATNERTLIASAVSLSACGHKFPLIVAPTGAAGVELMCAFNSFVLDFVARQKVGGTNMAFYALKQLAVVPPTVLSEPCAWSSGPVGDWVTVRALELVFTAWDMRGFASDLAFVGPPFRWIPTRRELLRAELDAAFFHLYGIERDDVDYIMDTFPIVRRKDEAAHGEYRTKRLILERYDAMAAAIATGTEYQTVLDPPPADPSLCHPESTRPSWA